MKNLKIKSFNRPTKILLTGVTLVGSGAGIVCGYVYTVIESLVVTK